MLSYVIGFHQDVEGVWVAELSCSHVQHVPHNPPLQLREWTTTEAGRQSKIGAQLECPYCNMAVVPTAAVAYKRTATFTEETTPEGLLREHRTKPGSWAEVIIEEGKLQYICDRGTFFLNQNAKGVIEPEVPHSVRVIGPVRFHIVFMRVPG